MFQPPSPHHGFVEVGAATLGVVAVAIGITAALAYLGVPQELLLASFVLVAAALLFAFRRFLFRLLPERPDRRAGK